MSKTSTIYSHAGGVCNNVFAARSRNPDGPWFKWTGSGWGETRETLDEDGNPLLLRWQGNPAPIVYFDEPWECWGAGEPSFVRVGDTLFIYFTWTSKDADGKRFCQTRAAAADLRAGDNWPGTVAYRGIAIRRPGGGCDSSDVVYVEEAEKFLILCTDHRFTEQSCLAVYESDDGLRFERVCEVRTHVGEKCHNCGIAGGPDRHVSLKDGTIVGYAYGSQWGFWGTRFHKAVIELTEEPDFSDAANPGSPYPVSPWPMPADPRPIHITTVPHFHVMKVSGGPKRIDLQWVDSAYDFRPCPEEEVTVDGYDPQIVRFEGLKCEPLRPGTTSAVARWKGRSVEFPITVQPESMPDRSEENRKLVSFLPQVKEYTLCLSENERKQVRGKGIYDDGSWFEVFDGITLSGYDDTVIRVIGDADFAALKTGSTSLTASCGGLSFTVRVNVMP